jgi:hypothetical protein
MGMLTRLKFQASLEFLNNPRALGKLEMRQNLHLGTRPPIPDYDFRWQAPRQKYLTGLRDDEEPKLRKARNESS